MPIKNLTDRQAAFPEIGRIRKGSPKKTVKKNGKEVETVGDDLDYFRVEFDEAEKQAAATFVACYKEQPKELNILLPFNTVDENFDAWREAYVAGGLLHRCDGERVWYSVNKQSGEVTVKNGEPYAPCDQEVCPGKPTGRLKVLIPELHRLAYLTLITGSTHDILNISRQLAALLEINGRLAGVPLKLRRRPVKISTPSGKGGKRARRTKNLISVEADPAWVKAKIQAMRIAALPSGLNGEDLPMIEAPVDVSEGDWLDEETEVPSQPINQNGNPVGLDPASQFWHAIRGAGLDNETANNILKETNEDFEAALQIVIKQHTPPW
jgi:hypothetical protein